MANTGVNSHLLRFVWLPLALVLASSASSLSRAGDEEPKAFEVASLSFEGNETFGDGQLGDLMATKETAGFFGRLFRGISESLGSPNRYYDASVLAADREKLRAFYDENGFSNARIDTVLTFMPEEQSVAIQIRINEGYRALIDSVRYVGLRHAAEGVWFALEAEPLIRKGNPFVKSLVEQEMRRVSGILQDEGYAESRIVRDSTAAIRMLSSGNYTIVLHFALGKRFRFGEVGIRQQPDSLRSDEITDDMVLKQLDYEPGDVFSEAKRRDSERNLNRVGVFSQARISLQIPPDTSESVSLASEVVVTPADKHELAPEVSISDEDKAFNLGAGLVYLHRNFLGGARTFAAHLRFRTQTLGAFPDYFAVNSDAVSNIDVGFEVIQPYIFTNKIKGSWKFTLSLDKQKLYRQAIIKNSLSFSNRLGRYTTGFLDWTLQRVRLQRNTDVVIDLSDPETLRQYNALLALEKETQFNSIISFTLQRDNTDDIFSPARGYVHAITLEESGLLPLLLKDLQPGVPFTQFYRLILSGRWFTDLSRNRSSILGLRLKAGTEAKYGESSGDSARVIPQTHRFYAGGGGSVRGWPSRGLIAGGIPELGGNLTLEGGAELRFHPLKGSNKESIFNNIWLVTFLDLGNVWTQVGDFRLEQVALATGLGFRYDTFFGPFRIDFGIRVYDPGAIEPDKRWITTKKFFAETIHEGALHFGIGHAF